MAISDAPPKALRIEGQSPHQADERAHVQLVCRANAAVFKDNLSWSFDGRRINRASTNGRVYVEQSVSPRTITTTLHIRRANLNDSGSYACHAEKRKFGLKRNESTYLEILREYFLHYTTLKV